MIDPNLKTGSAQNTLVFRFFASLVPMIYFFVQHKVYRIPGGKFSIEHVASLRLMTCGSIYVLQLF